MKIWPRLSLALLALSLVLAACTRSQADPITTSTTATFPVTTTTAPPVTTTTEEDQCPDVFCVVYHIRPEAKWSDDTPVTAGDFVYTHEVMVDPFNGAVVGTGYELITGSEVIDDKTVLFAFSKVYGPWQTLFDVVLPRHVLAGTDSGSLTRRALTTTSGPFVLHGVLEGDRIILRRNPRYWATNDPLSGSPLGDVGEIHFVYPESVRNMLRDLEGGEIDLINPRPLDWIVDEVGDMAEVTHQLGPGPFWDHIDFNHDDPLLSQRWVREAITLAIDREALLDGTVRTVDPEASPLDSTVWMVDSVNYQSNFEDRYNPEMAEQILLDHFCERGDDDIYSCQGRRMSFVWATTLGDDFRETHFELARATLEAIGVELVADFMTPSDLFSSEVFFGGPGVWQIINFSWKAAADPHLANSTYFCDGAAPNGFGALNVNRYCDEDVDSLVRSTEGIADSGERARAYNDADTAYLNDLALIPLYQKPAFLAWNATLTGPEINISRSTDLWNVAAWSGKEVIVIALGSEPESLDPLMLHDSDTALVLAAMFNGAFGVDPNLDFKPVLIESAETFVSDS
ncbi:MAG: ABC transporter substrate-binding protein [Acidimicrobiia bacterium]